MNPRVTCPTSAYMEFVIDDTIDDDDYFELVTDAGGLGTRANLPPDTYTITQFVPNGVTGTFAWDCYDTNTTSDRVDPLTVGNTVQVKLTEGAAIRCDWFNVTGGSGRVVVNTHGCGTDVPAYVLELDQLFAQCSIDTGRIEFSVISGDDTYVETLPASSNPLTLASFNTVPSGYVSIGEKLPGGWGTPIVYCQVLGANGEVDMLPTEMELVVGQYNELRSRTRPDPRLRLVQRHPGRHRSADDRADLPGRRRCLRVRRCPGHALLPLHGETRRGRFHRP